MVQQVYILVLVCQGRKYSRHLYPTGVKDPWAFSRVSQILLLYHIDSLRCERIWSAYSDVSLVWSRLFFTIISLRTNDFAKSKFVLIGFRYKFEITVVVCNCTRFRDCFGVYYIIASLLWTSFYVCIYVYVKCTHKSFFKNNLIVIL